MTQKKNMITLISILKKTSSPFFRDGNNGKKYVFHTNRLKTHLSDIRLTENFLDSNQNFVEVCSLLNLSVAVQNLILLMHAYLTFLKQVIKITYHLFDNTAYFIINCTACKNHFPSEKNERKCVRQNLFVNLHKNNSEYPLDSIKYLIALCSKSIDILILKKYRRYYFLNKTDSKSNLDDIKEYKF